MEGLAGFFKVLNCCFLCKLFRARGVIFARKCAINALGGCLKPFSDLYHYISVKTPRVKEAAASSLCLYHRARSSFKLQVFAFSKLGSCWS